MCEVYVDEPASIFQRRPVKRARKAHQCDCCGGPIHAGESYIRHFSVYDGAPTSERECAACARVIDEFGDEHSVFFNPSSMPAAIQDCADYSVGPDREHWLRVLREMQARAPEVAS